MDMKPKTEIYSISYSREGYDGKSVRVLYMVGNQVPSYTGRPTSVESIKLAFGVLTVNFEDGTSHSLGYDPMTVEIYRRKIKTEEDGESEGRDNKE
jgi:hypothetical protein